MRESEHNQLEQLLGEVAAARRAGVFSDTPLDPFGLLRSPVAAHPVRIAARWVSGVAAAAAVICLVVLGLPDRVGRTELGGQTSRTELVTTTGEFLECFGQTVPADPRCQSSDVDSDGDIDLRDYSGFVASR